MAFKFKNAAKMTRNRKSEGETGIPVPMPGGDILWVLAATNANPRWEKDNEEYNSLSDELKRAGASEERLLKHHAEWYTRLFVLRWNVMDDNDQPVPFSKEACEEYLLLDDALPTLANYVYDNRKFRVARVEAVVSQGKGESNGESPTAQT